MAVVGRMPERLLRVKEVAEMFGVTPGALYAWRAKDRGPESFKLGNVVVYREDQVLAYLAEQEAATRRGGDRS